MPNKIFIAPETPITWTDTAGDAVLDIGGLVASTGVRQGARHDLGTGSRAGWYEWRIIIDGFDTAPVVGEAIDVYLGFSDGTNSDGNLGTSDAASSTVVLPNLTPLGSAVVQTTTAADNVVTSGRVFISSRYVIPVIHNRTADNLLSTSDSHRFILTPIPDEVQ